MPEKPEDKSIIPSSAPESHRSTSSDLATARESVESRLAKADSPQEALQWVEVRGQLLQQNEKSKDEEQRRFLERVRVPYNLGLSTGSFVVSIIFVIKGFYQVGFFILGAGLYTIAPEYIKMFLTKEKGKKDEER